MRKFIASILLLCASTLRAQMGPVPGSGGGAVGSGTALTACTSSILYADASSLLKCDPAAVVNGSVSTAGRSILTIRDTISGSSATSNFLNVTGTFPATLSAATNGAYFSFTADDSAQDQRGLYATVTGQTSATGKQSAIYGELTGAYANNTSAGVYGNNTSVGATISVHATGVVGASISNTASRTFLGVGGFGNSINGASGNNVGGFFAGSAQVTTAALSAGTIGLSRDATAAAGGYFAFTTTSYSDPGAISMINGLFTGKAALIADNASVAANIFEARDNGTAVFTVADGGTWTSTAVGNLNGGMNLAAAQLFGLGGTSATFGGMYLAGTNTPNALEFGPGTTSNSWIFMERQDIGAYDAQNACTTGLGTAACTDPTLIIHSHNQDTGEFLSMAHDGKAAVLAGGNSTVLDGLIRLGGTVTLTESSATTVLTIPIPVSTGSGGIINYVVDARDATNVQIRTGNVNFAVANTSGGTETCNVFGVGPTTQAAGGDTTNPANPTQVQDGSGVGAITSGTLTYAWSVDTSGSNSCVLKLNAVSSLTQTTLQVHYTVISTGPAIVTGG